MSIGRNANTVSLRPQQTLLCSFQIPHYRMYRGNLNPNLHKVYKNSSGLAAPDNSIHIPKRYYEVLDVFSPADPKQHFLQI